MQVQRGYDRRPFNLVLGRLKMESSTAGQNRGSSDTDCAGGAGAALLYGEEPAAMRSQLAGDPDAGAIWGLQMGL